jgi:hypothetical protein
MQGIVYRSNEQTARDIEQLVAAHAR